MGGVRVRLYVRTIRGTPPSHVARGQECSPPALLLLFSMQEFQPTAEGGGGISEARKEE